MPLWGQNGAMNKTKPEVHKLNLRLPVNLIEEARAEAQAMGLSLNSYILLAVQNYVPWTRSQRKRWEPKAARPEAASATRPTAKVGRNDPCPCGSGRKAKTCHPESC